MQLADPQPTSVQYDIIQHCILATLKSNMEKRSALKVREYFGGALQLIHSEFPLIWESTIDYKHNYL